MAPILGLFAFDMFGKVGFFYSLVVLFLLFLLARRIVCNLKAGDRVERRECITVVE